MKLLVVQRAAMAKGCIVGWILPLTSCFLFLLPNYSTPNPQYFSLPVGSQSTLSTGEVFGEGSGMQISQLLSKYFKAMNNEGLL